MTPAEWIARHVEVAADGCHLWTGSRNPSGYGVTNSAWRVEAGGSHLVHRLAFVARFGAIPDGATIDHTCHNADVDCIAATCEHRRCVNPDHLEAVELGVNMARGKRSRATCKNGHPRTADNTYTRANGSRHCRTCRSVQRRARTLRERSAA